MKDSNGKLVANIDLDGVVYDFVDAMKEAFDYRFPKLGAADWPEPDRWSLAKSWPIPGGETGFYEVMAAEILDGQLFRIGHVIDGARDGLRKLEMDGWHIRIVTSKTFRDPQVTHKARTSTLRWLHEQRIPHHTVSFTDSAVGKKQYKAHLIVDDKPTVKDWMQDDALNVIFHSSWNRIIPTFPTDVRMVRAKTWDEVLVAAELVKEQTHG